MTEALPPGPRTPRLAQAVLWGLRYPQFTTAGHRRFGSTFTVRPGTIGTGVLTTDRDAIRRLLTGDPLRKWHGNDAVRPLIDDGSVMLLEPAEHLERRKLLLPAFHGERVQAYAEQMRRLLREEVERWSPGQEVVMLPTGLNLTIEVILDAVLGVASEDLRRRFRTLIDDLLFYPLGTARLRLSAWLGRGPTPPRRVRALIAFAASFPTPAVATYYPETKIRAWWNPLTLRWWRHYDHLMDLFDELIADARNDPRLAERNDILATLVQARTEEGEALSNEDLRQDLITLIGAGHETTAAATAWAMVLLAHNPDVRRRARAAARDGDDAYLDAVVKEVLRIRSPIPVGAGRRLDQSFEVDGHRVPAGTLILIDAWGLHHDPAVFPEPDRFRPERFLDGQPEPYAWLPFGGGAHRCLGASLAELEIKVALEEILRSVDVEPAERELPPIARRGITLVPHGGGTIRIRGGRREPAPPT